MAPADTTRRDLLLELASSQAGLFTAAQARQCGYSTTTQRRHVDRGYWVRVDRGIFHIAGTPRIEGDWLVRWYLWTGGRGVVSHRSAAGVWGLGPLTQRRVDLTVPPGFRRRTEKAVLHRAELDDADVVARGPVQVTTPVRTLVDLASSGVAGHRALAHAVDEALTAGLVTEEQLVAAATDDEVAAASVATALLVRARRDEVRLDR